MGSAQSRLDRAYYFQKRAGLQFGVPKDAYRMGVEQRRRMERAARASIQAGAPLWVFIGPMPIKNEIANLGGALFGTGFAATGRVSAIALDPSGNIYVGTASGGVWLSQDHGATFSFISRALPTQSIGAIAIDNSSSATPIVYVGTGEGNNPFGGDSFYGLGMFKTADMGANWTPVDPNGKFFGNGPYQSFTSMSIPCLYMWAGTGFGFSTSRGSADWLEGSKTVGSIYESLNAGVDGSWHRVFGGTHPGGNGGPVRTFIVGATRDAVDPSILIPAMFSAVDFEGIFSANFSCGAGQPLSPWSNAPIPSSSFGRASLAVRGPSVNRENIEAIVGAASGGNYSGEYAGFFTSTDGGASWVQATTPCAETSDNGANWTTLSCGHSGPNITTLDGDTPAGPNGSNPDVFSQSSYDQALAISPADNRTVYFGGVRVQLG